jgi:hypothetical protein
MRIVLAALLLLLSVTAIPALGKKEAAKNEPPMFRDRNGPAPFLREKTREEIEALPLVRVTGIVRLVGSAPRLELVLSGEDGEWFIETENIEPFRNLQQQTATVEGRQDSEILNAAADGRVALRRLILRDARVVEE